MTLLQQFVPLQHQHRLCDVTWQQQNSCNDVVHIVQPTDALLHVVHMMYLSSALSWFNWRPTEYITVLSN